MRSKTADAHYHTDSFAGLMDLCYQSHRCAPLWVGSHLSATYLRAAAEADAEVEREENANGDLTMLLENRELVADCSDHRLRAAKLQDTRHYLANSSIRDKMLNVLFHGRC